MKTQILVSIFSSGGHLVQWSGKVSAIFGRGSPNEHSGEIISKSVQLFQNPSSSLAEVI